MRTHIGTRARPLRVVEFYPPSLGACSPCHVMVSYRWCTDVGSRPWLLASALHVDDAERGSSAPAAAAAAAPAATPAPATNDDELPEDRFHRQDIISTHMLLQKKAEAEANKKAREEREQEKKQQKKLHDQQQQQPGGAGDAVGVGAGAGAGHASGQLGLGGDVEVMDAEELLRSRATAAAATAQEDATPFVDDDAPIQPAIALQLLD